jgi:cell division protein ZapD
MSENAALSPAACHGLSLPVRNQIVFEHPLNERSRMLLRLSHLFGQFAFHVGRDSLWDSRAAMTALLDIASVLGRADIKSELIKELERHAATLGRMAADPRVDRERLQEILGDIEANNRAIQRLNGQLGLDIRNDDFLKAVAQRSAVPGGNCDFDLPHYYFWLQKPFAERAADLERWSLTVAPVKTSVDLLLSLIRGSSRPVQEIARQGFFQQSLDPGLPSQLVRVILPAQSGLVAEISGGKHRFTIRFLEGRVVERPPQTRQDVTFGLTTCVI